MSLVQWLAYHEAALKKTMALLCKDGWKQVGCREVQVQTGGHFHQLWGVEALYGQGMDFPSKGEGCIKAIWSMVIDYRSHVWFSMSKSEISFVWSNLLGSSPNSTLMSTTSS